MANPIKGEASLKVEGREYTLCFSIDAMCALEEKLDRTMQDIMSDLTDPTRIGVRLTRALLWASLREHHSEITLKMAGDLIPAAGGVPAVVERISLAIQRAFPTPEASDPHPQKPDQDGTGPATSANG